MKNGHLVGPYMTRTDGKTKWEIMIALTVWAVFVGTSVGATIWIVTSSTGDAAPGTAARRVRDHLYFLAGDDLRGRESGTDGYDRAGDYVEEELKRYELEPLFGKSYRQPFTIRRVKVDPAGHVTIERPGGTDRLPLLKGATLMHTTPGAFRATGKRMVFIGLGIHEPEVGWDDYAGLDLEDACVVGIYDTPREWSRALPEKVWRFYQDHEAGGERKLKAIADRGASCIVMFTSGKGDVDLDEVLSSRRILNRMLLLDSDDRTSLPSFISFALTRDEAKRLFEGQPHPALSNQRPTPFEMTDVAFGYAVSASLTEDVRTFNVGALIRGSDPEFADEVVVLSGHLDGQGMQGGRVLNAANDNAAAASALLEAARVLGEHPPRRSVAILFPAAEEMGLLGSLFFVRDPPVPFDQIVLNANMEMIGTPAKNGRRHSFRVTGRLTDEIDELVDAVEERHGGVDFNYALRVEGSDKPFRRADHVNFFLRGVPTIYFYGGNDSNYHQPSDDADRVDLDKVTTMAELLVTLVEVADQRAALPSPAPDWGAGGR